MNKKFTKYLRLVLILVIALPVLFYFLTLNAFEDATQVRADVDGEYVELTPGSSTLFTTPGSSTLFTKVKDKFKNFKLSKISGTDKKLEGKEYYLIDSRKPKLRFKRPTDSDRITHFRLIVFYTEGKWKEKSEKSYISLIQNIKVEGDDKKVVKEKDYEVTYTKNYIEVSPKSNDLKLKTGQYLFMIRAFDTDLNYTDSGKIKVKVVDSVEEETTPKLSGELNIKVDKIGSLIYNDKFKLFYYSNPRMNLAGHIEPAANEVALEIYVNDKLAAEVKTDSAGKYNSLLNLNRGLNKIQVKSKLVTESGMQVTKEFNITIR